MPELAVFGTEGWGFEPLRVQSGLTRVYANREFAIMPLSEKCVRE